MLSIKNKISALILCIISLMLSCEKYVDIKTQGNLVPDQAINFRYLLNRSSTFSVNPNLSDFASSDININDVSQMQALTGLYQQSFWAPYTWQSMIYPISTTYEQDENWNAMYAVIFNANTVINEVPETKGTEAEKAELIAEALVHRADAYLALVNNYAKPYNSSTAATDLGLPILKTQTFAQSLTRASIKETYDFIIADLLSAIPALPETQAYNTLPSKASAYAELARAYQLIGDWENANKYADLVLAVRNVLIDLSIYSATPTATTYPRAALNPEILLYKVPLNGSRINSPSPFKIGDEVLALMGTADLRYQYFSVPAATISTQYTGRFFYKESITGDTRQEGPTVQEMMLIKAEYYARSGNSASAMQWVNNLRMKRFKQADFVSETASSANDALIKVINERRIEFFGTCLRWWDMRRLKDDPLFKRTYTRVFNDVTYTLEPNSNRYVFPIAEYLTRLSPELQPNP